ncbi:Tat pathway signal protein [Catellatospora bangladeshensis]|uniref:Tat pathway signal protein n=1 Tax=Catellatospora bangladeshensis TaxID=310355 RepID=A0A8J3JP81_9ACTN|nr:Tat pathway signal protein [Catellatospora bangladeshensis]GIF82338.1 Tat pathway signal protein [Catellatospora bangladeshensis]
MRADAPRNDRLYALIAQSGISYEALARSVCHIAAENGDTSLRANKSSVAHWIAGTRPQPRTAGYLAEALSRRLARPLTPAELGLGSGDDSVYDPATLPRDPVAAVAHLGRADVDRRTLISGAAYSVAALLLPLQQPEIAARAHAARSRPMSAVGQGEIDAVRQMTTAFNAADERLGGGHARTAVVEYLTTDVTAYLRGSFATDTLRRSMFAAAAQLAYLAGWKAHDLGLPGLAQRYYLHSYQLAAEADPHAHAAYGLRILAHQAMDLGRREHCVDLAHAALDRVKGRTDPDTESLFWLTAARAYATGGNNHQARSALTKAEQLLDRSRGDAAPEWASLGGPAEARLANQSGKALQAMGDLKAAEDQLRRSARCWNPDTHPRIHALTLADLAEIQCARGNVEAACQTWNTALDGMIGIRSARTRDAVASMRAHLAAYRRRGLAAAQRLDARAAVHR